MTDLIIRKAFVAHARWYKGESGGMRADFTNKDFRCRDFSSTNFHRAIFVRTNLAGATMSCSNFYESDFTEASLERAYLSCADCHGANFTNAILDGANLANADFSGCDFTGASLVNTYLPTCNLDGAVLNWDSHDLVAEVLRREAGNDPWKLRIAGAILVHRYDKWFDGLPWYCGPGEDGENCYQWATDMLTLHVVDGDNAPAVLRETRND